MTKVTIPNTVTSIGAGAFSDCSALTNLTIPNSVISIGDSAFSGCSALTSMVIPGSVASIGDSTFYDCSNLTSVTIPGSVTSIGEGAFYNCSNLATVAIPGSVTSIGSEAFDGCGKLASVSLAQGLATIGEQAFAGCSSLVSITIPASVTSIGAEAFGDYWGHCSAMTSINVAAGNTVYASANGALLDAAGTTLITVPQGVTGAFAIPAGVTVVDDDAFDYCGKITAVSVPASVASLSGNIFDDCNVSTLVIENASCSMGEKLGLNYDAVVYGAKGSAAENYAKNFDCEFHPIGLAAPQITKLENTTAGVTVTWGAVSGAVQYRVYYRTGSGSWTSAGTTAGTSFTWDDAQNGGTYSFTVQCVTLDGSFAASGYDTTGKSITYRLPLPTPVMGKVSNIATGVTMTWGAVSGAVQYRVYYRTGSGDWTKIADVTGTSYTWTGAKSGVTYSFAVQALSQDGTTDSARSAEKVQTFIGQPKITKMENTASGMKVTWGKVNGAARYTVFYKLKGAAKWTKIGTTTKTSYTRAAKNLKNGKTYVFTVRCVANDKKTYTSDFDKTGKSLTYYAAPTVKISAASDGGIKVSWNKISGVSRYMVYYRENGGSWKKIGTTTKTSYTRAAKYLKNGKTYEFAVRCVKNDKKTFLSGYKASNSLKHLATPTVKITKTASGIKVTWNKVSGASRYMVYYRQNGGSWKKIGTTTKTSYTRAAKYLKAGVKYQFTVRCVANDKKTFLSGYAASNSLKYTK